MREVIKVFDELASKWDSKHAYIEEVYDGESERLLKCISDYVRDGMRIADMGCGTGKVTEHILRTGKDVSIMAVDGSEKMIEVTTSKFKSNEKVCCINCDLKNFEDKEGFDIIFLLQVIHHLPNPKDVMEHITKLLKPEGKIILLVIGEKHMQSIVPYSEEEDAFGRFNKNKLIQLFELNSQSSCRIYDDHFKMKFKTRNDINSFLVDVSLIPKMMGYQMNNHAELVESAAHNNEDGVVVEGHHYTLIYEKNDNDEQVAKDYKNSVIDAYNIWSESYSDVVLDKLERRGYGYEALAEVIQKYLSVDEEGRILEIGAGTGLVGSRVRNKNPELIIDCVEISSQMAAKIPTSIYNEINITDFENCYESSKKYNCVYTTFMMHHAYSITNVLKKIYDVLEDGAILIVVDLLLSEEDFQGFNNELHSAIHEYGAGVNYYTSSQFKKKLSICGFTLEKEMLLGSDVGLSHRMFVARKMKGR